VKYDIKAKPTIYKGYAFRSRLEAKWARFFDLMKWTWEYEPFDLDGWSPDFVIKGRPHDILVEVKPFMDLDNDDARETISKIRKCLHRTNNRLAIIVGTGPRFSSDFGQHEGEYWADGRLGWFVYRDYDMHRLKHETCHPRAEYKLQCDEDPAMLFEFTGQKANRFMSMTYADGTVSDLIWGAPNANEKYWPKAKFQTLWARACNRTTFKSY
jgi:hypothetical protein